MLRLVTILSLCLFGLMVSVSSVSSAGDWRQFRGPGGQGVSNETNLPTRWSDTENLLWKTEMPGAGASSPIILGDRVYLTCYSGFGAGVRNSGTMEDLRRHVVCVNRADGKIVWNKTLLPKLPESERVRDHGFAAPTPVTDGEHLYVFFGKSGVYKFDLNGNQIWNTEVGSTTHGWGCGTSPVLYQNLVIVNASVESRSLVALDKQSGAEVWRAPGMRASWNTPILVDVKGGKQELVVSVKGSILAFDPQTGAQLWSCRGVPDYVCPSAVAKDGIVYVIGGRSAKAIAVRAGGRDDVTDTHLVWNAQVGANVSSPVIYGDHLYWINEGGRTALCLRLDTGEIEYQKRLNISPYASTVAADGKLYVVDRYSGTYVLAAKPKFEQISHNRFENDRSIFNASIAISDGNIFIRSNRFLYCIGHSE
ncbi:MAG: PQQ-binding-like beta-propeller repeat protein [Planctomycetes bacterium]|nr:PQQ-binding-like beta-propeller repeat protein [Planctomycetota bacterium]